MRARLPSALIGLLLSSAAALADCDLPTLGPTDTHFEAQNSDRSTHVVTGVVGICDGATRSFVVALPALHRIQRAAVALSLAGFSRKYGVHQIGFVLQSVSAVPSERGITVRYGAAVDGFERYQLAYTLYIETSP